MATALGQQFADHLEKVRQAAVAVREAAARLGEAEGRLVPALAAGIDAAMGPLSLILPRADRVQSSPPEVREAEAPRVIEQYRQWVEARHGPRRTTTC